MSSNITESIIEEFITEKRVELVELYRMVGLAYGQNPADAKFMKLVRGRIAYLHKINFIRNVGRGVWEVA